MSSTRARSARGSPSTCSTGRRARRATTWPRIAPSGVNRSPAPYRDATIYTQPAGVDGRVAARRVAALRAAASRRCHRTTPSPRSTQWSGSRRSSSVGSSRGSVIPASMRNPDVLDEQVPRRPARRRRRRSRARPERHRHHDVGGHRARRRHDLVHPFAVQRVRRARVGARRRHRAERSTRQPVRRPRRSPTASPAASGRCTRCTATSSSGPTARSSPVPRPAGEARSRPTSRCSSRSSIVAATSQQAIDRPRWVHGMPRTSATDDTRLPRGGARRSRAPRLTALGHHVEVLDGDKDDQFGSCTIVAANANAHALRQRTDVGRPAAVAY